MNGATKGFLPQWTARDCCEIWRSPGSELGADLCSEAGVMYSVAELCCRDPASSAEQIQVHGKEQKGI